VETDDPQVTINQRFKVFFPEKRPFFIENAGYFQTPVNLVYSRYIVDPGAGVRLTGKAGRWSLGAIAINDREPGRVAAPDPLAGAGGWGGSGALLDVGRDGRYFDYSGTFLALDPGFNAPLGFVERTGIRQMEHKWQFKFRPRGKAVLNYGPEVKVAYVWAPDG